MLSVLVLPKCGQRNQPLRRLGHRQATGRFQKDFLVHDESITVRLSRPGGLSGNLGVHGRPHVSTAVVTNALADGLFVPNFR